jgi:hypothetical protein
MLKKIMQKIINRFGMLYTIELGLGGWFLIAMIIFTLQMAVPTKRVFFESQASDTIQLTSAGSLPDDSQKNSTNLRETLGLIKPGLFKAASGLSDKPMADKTIERIRSQLKLQCIMQMSGKAAAYINIKNMGLKKCTVGEKICDLFTVISINEKSVEISIIDHRVMLYP